MAEFFFMGGYWAYVWPAYALTAAAIGWLVYASLGALSRAERHLQRQTGGKPEGDGSA